MLGHIQHFLKQGHSQLAVFKGNAAIAVGLAVTVIHLGFLSCPVRAESGFFAPAHVLNQIVDIKAVREPGIDLRIVELIDQPLPNGLCGLVKFLSLVSHEVKPMAKDKPQQKADEIKSHGVGSYGLGDLIKQHGLGFLLYFVVGALLTLDFRRPK